MQLRNLPMLANTQGPKDAIHSFKQVRSRAQNSNYSHKAMLYAVQ